MRTCGVVGVIFVLGRVVLLMRRQRRLGVPAGRGWYALAFVIDVGALLFLLSRLMLALTLVLASLRHD